MLTNHGLTNRVGVRIFHLLDGPGPKEMNWTHTLKQTLSLPHNTLPKPNNTHVQTPTIYRDKLSIISSLRGF